jgi:recombination protein RecT
MGAISKAVEVQEQALQAQVAVRHTFSDDLRASMPRLMAVAGKEMNEERLFQLGISAYNKTPHLAECQPATILGCLMQAVTLGFEPSAVDGLGNCYIIPRKNKKTGVYEATFMLGYRGMVALAAKSGINIEARIVHANDFFEYEYGLEPRLAHRPTTGEPGAFIATYAVATLPGGYKTFDVMTVADVERVKSRSNAGGKFSPWETDYEEMARKTVIRRMFKTLPINREVAKAAANDECSIDINAETGELFE